MENSILHGYAPEDLFRRFEELSAIPRPSGSEAAVADYLMRFAGEHGLTVRRDELHNVVLQKPGSPGCETLPSVLLQGHTDMVCEKNAATRHDFATQGIRLVQEGGFLRADGTTLGADNGVAVAMMLAVLGDSSLAHPPLECAFTVQEETGLAGAKNLNPAWITARTMINLDSEDEGVATVSCAGGLRAALSREDGWSRAEGPGLALRLRGLLGGHSGMEIGLERGNANKLMGRVLGRLYEGGVRFRLAALSGGSKDNAIPRECDCLLLPDSEADAARALELARDEAEAIGGELAATEPDFCLNLEPAPVERALTEAVTGELIALLCLAPNGPQSRSAGAGGFVVSSLNLGMARADGARVSLTFAPRSSVASRMDELRRQLGMLAKRLHFTMEVTSEYPGWSYAESSPIREVLRACYREQTGGELRCEAIHAGLECGLFAQKLPGLDAIAIGPNVRGAHTPQETLDLASFARTYDLLTRALARLAG